MMNLNNAFNNEFMTKIIELNKNYALIKNIIEEENKFDPKYKTELCKKFQSTGKCPYGFKCRFAHGKEELITKFQGANYKKKPCKTFNEKGYCPYGSRCSFQHDERKFSEVSFSYFYLQLFLFKKYNFLPSRKNFYSNRSSLLNGRLPFFESLTKNSLEEQKLKESFNDKSNNSNNELLDRNNSLSTISNISNEELEQKKYNNNTDIYLVGLIQNDKLNENIIINQENKENICENTKC